MRPYSTFRLQILLSVFCCLFLQACASKKDFGSSTKTGMYVDAVLKCAIEYPLSWTKERRITYGSKSGEIRWKPPKDENTMLRLAVEHKAQGTIDPEQQIESVLQEFADLEISVLDKEELPAGEATHIIGDTAEKHIEIYQFSHANHSYLIALTVLQKNVKIYSDVMKKIISSFQILQ